MGLDLCYLCTCAAWRTRIVRAPDLSLYLLADFLQKIFASGKFCRKRRAIAELSGPPAPAPLVPWKGGSTPKMGTPRMLQRTNLRSAPMLRRVNAAAQHVSVRSLGLVQRNMLVSAR